MKDLHVSWEEYRRLIETLAFNVYDSGWKFDSLLCLARGGLRPGDILSRIFDMPLNILSTSSYREAAGTIQGSLDVNFQRFPTLDAKKLVNAPKMSAHHRGICHF